MRLGFVRLEVRRTERLGPDVIRSCCREFSLRRELSQELLAVQRQ